MMPVVFTHLSASPLSRGVLPSASRRDIFELNKMTTDLDS